MKQKKREKNATSTIFFTILLQLMLSSKLLQLVIDGKKIFIVIFSSRKQKATLNLGFFVKKYCECCTSKKK